MVTAQPSVPLHAPLQPEKAHPLVGVAVKLTFVPDGKVATHATFGQLIPEGELVTAPLLTFDTDRVYDVF
jgi:hypothetical protein